MSVVAHARDVPSSAWPSFRSAGDRRFHVTGFGPAGQGSPVEKLPDTILSHIISYLSVREQVAAAELVSRSWRRAAQLLSQSTIDFRKGTRGPQIQVSIEIVSRLVARAVRLRQHVQPSFDGSTINPVTMLHLSGCCCIPRQSPAQLIAYCIQLCPNLQQLIACEPGDGRVKPTLPLTADGALQVLRACNKHPKIIHVVIDVDAYSLADTWETTSYQRAIGVEPLWQTFLLLLEPASLIAINRLTFAGYRTSGHARSSVAPSEFRKVTSSRAKDLAAVLARNSSICGLLIPGGYLTSSAMEAICTSAKVHSTVTTLELSGRPLFGNITDEQLARGL